MAHYVHVYVWIYGIIQNHQYLCFCLNYLDRFILKYIGICQSHVFLCVFHYIASILLFNSLHHILSAIKRTL